MMKSTSNRAAGRSSLPPSNTLPSTSSASAIQQDWDDREFVEILQMNIVKTAAFLNEFDLTVRSKISALNEKLGKLERSVDLCEAVIKSTQDKQRMEQK